MIAIRHIERVQGAVQEAGLTTPFPLADSISRDIGSSVYLKLENLQPTGSFKVRGALVKLSSLESSSRQNGVIAMSAGNHAQGVAYHARELGIPAKIVMPRQTPFTKVNRTKALGAEVILEGESLSESQEFADALAKQDDLTFIHPYDDEEIISGQGTIGLELMGSVPDLDVVFVPIGGGGLIAGISIVLRAMNPACKVIGVEAELFPSMKNEIYGEDTPCEGSTLAEGIAVKQPGDLTKAIISDTVSEIITVSEAEIEGSMQLLLREQSLVAEGAGAASLAALLKSPGEHVGKKVGLIVSGGNVDARLVSSVLLRSLVREGRLVSLRVEISDQPGALSRLTQIIGDNGGDIIEVNHQRLFYDVSVKSTEVDISLETRDTQHLDQIVRALDSEGYSCRLLSGMAGGRDIV